MLLSTTLCALSMSIALVTVETAAVGPGDGTKQARGVDGEDVAPTPRARGQFRFEMVPAEIAPRRVPAGAPASSTSSVERLLHAPVARPPSAEDLVSDRFEWKFKGLPLYDAEDDTRQPSSMRLYPSPRMTKLVVKF